MIKAKYNTKQKEIIWNRDNWCCIICWINSPIHFHHVYFSQEAMYTKDRNDPKYWVCICDYHHRMAHSCAKWEWIRQEAIKYITNL